MSWVSIVILAKCCTATLLKCFDHSIKLPERRLRSPVKPLQMTSGAGFSSFTEGVAKYLFIHIVLLEAIHDTIDFLGKVRSGMSISLSSSMQGKIVASHSHEALLLCVWW